MFLRKTVVHEPVGIWGGVLPFLTTVLKYPVSPDMSRWLAVQTPSPFSSQGQMGLRRACIRYMLWILLFITYHSTVAEDLEYMIWKVLEQPHSFQDSWFIQHGTVGNHYIKWGYRGGADAMQILRNCMDHIMTGQDGLTAGTKTVRLTEDQAKLIEKWINNIRRVEKQFQKWRRSALRRLQGK